MNRKIRVWFAALLFALGTSIAHANFHLFKIQQIYSNADGTVQFVVLSTAVDGENVWHGHYIASVSLDATANHNYTFLEDLPEGATAGKSVLVATQAFANLGIITPDFVVQNHFVVLGDGYVDFAGVDTISYFAGAIPTDGNKALFRDGSTKQAVATNFAGATASISLGGPPATNYGGLWWAAPGGVENGWGINFAHQGSIIFGTWFTYDTTGKGWWLTLITETNPSPGVYTANLLVTTGPPFNATPFVKTSGAPKVGTATLNFTDASNGTFHYELTLPGGTVIQTKAITQQQPPAPPLASCASAVTPLAAATNYQDIWWAGTSTDPGTEQGWGINFTHQGDLIFASWFTYDLDGTPLWVVATAAKTAPGVYKGDLYRPSGPRFDAYDKSQWKPNTPVGSLTLTFVNGNNATMDYTVQLASMMTPVPQTKSITRQLFTPQGTICH